MPGHFSACAISVYQAPPPRKKKKKKKKKSLGTRLGHTEKLINLTIMLLVKLKWVEHEIRGIVAETIWMTSEVGCV